MTLTEHRYKQNAKYMHLATVSVSSLIALSSVPNSVLASLFRLVKVLKTRFV